jgi:hypothetical protein
MITITETKELYTFAELSKIAQSNAINDLVQIWCEIPGEVPDDAQEAYDRAGRDSESMQTPWFFAEYVYDYCKEQIMRELSYLYFLKSGTFYRFIEE